MRLWHDRRRFLECASLIGAAGLLGLPKSAVAEAPPEVKTIRLRKSTVICFAPLYVLKAFLRAEGFENVQYPEVKIGTSIAATQTGDIDFDVNFAGAIVHAMDSGSKITVVGGMHPGCYELFARTPINTISDLKGKRIGIHRLNSGMHLYVSIMASYVGLDPQRDIDWIATEDRRALDLFAAGETDAFLGFPPEPQELRDQGVDRVIVNTMVDKPWSQYFCCMIYGNQDVIRAHPIATKRFLRALYKASDFCTANPEVAARQLVDSGFAKRYDYALETIRDVQYKRWREYDAEDTLRFYALRLHEAGFIKTTPNRIITEGADWRFSEELQQELKA